MRVQSMENKCHSVKTKSLSRKFSVVKLTQVRGYEPGILNIYGAVMTSWNTTVFNSANGLATGYLFLVNQLIHQQKPALTCTIITEPTETQSHRSRLATYSHGVSELTPATTDQKLPVERERIS